jgi:hypothetical protein
LAPFGQAVSEENIFLTLANQKKELLLVAIFVGQMEPNEDASCQVWLHIFYKASSFGSIRQMNMATKNNSFF